MSKRHHRLTRQASLCLMAGTLLGLSACDSCSKPPETTPDAGASKPLDMGAPKAQPDQAVEDPLKEAKADADTRGVDAAIALVDRANLVAADIEANAKGAVKPEGPKIKRTVEDKFKGKIDPREANKVFLNFDGAMKACYERSLKRNPGLEGQAMLTLRINADGSVMNAKASAISLKDATVFQCMETLTPKMKFPAPEGGPAIVQKTYTFKPAF